MLIRESEFQELLRYFYKEADNYKESVHTLIRRSSVIDKIIDSEASYSREKSGYEGLVLGIFEAMGLINIEELIVDIVDIPVDQNDIPYGLEGSGGHIHTLLKYNAFNYLKETNPNAEIQFEYSHYNYYIDVFDITHSIAIECGDNAPPKIISIICNSDINCLYILTYHKAGKSQYYMYKFNLTKEGTEKIFDVVELLQKPLKTSLDKSMANFSYKTTL